MALITQEDRAWQDAVEDAVHDAAAQHGLTADELLDVSDDDEGDPVGTGVDFVQRLDSLADADPNGETFAHAVAAEVASYAAELHAEPVGAEPIAAKYVNGQGDQNDKHPHEAAGSSKGGQFASTNTAPTSSPRGKLTYSGQRQGNPKKGGKGGAAAPSGWVMPTTTLTKGGNNDPAHVLQLQYLINELKLGGILADGNYGDSTEMAIKAIQTKLGLKATGTASPALMKRMKDAHTLSPCVDRGASQVAASASYVEADEDEWVAAAAEHDVTPGHDELHHYWVEGKGAALWRTWTELVAHLTKHVGPLKAKTFASRWFFERYGFYAGDDKNRVMNGKPPRGHLVGPG